MADIIELLPDSVANQIAAGEVIQRPASIIKELLENSIDAGADHVKIIIKDAGKTLVQVIDNGIGMSETDARMAFERHATSKIKTSEDLFQIRTKGFRGEALASIVSIAQVDLKTRQPEMETGTQLKMAASQVDSQEPVSCQVGTNFAVRNLFFNVPARRKFLKSNTTEFKHIVNEFQRVAMAHPEVEMELFHNDNLVFNLTKGNIKQRLIQLFGKSMNQNLNRIETTTSIISVSGYIGKPEYARKTTGEQFFFINNRYMRHPYFHRAIIKAYEGLLPPESYPAYFLYFEADPSSIDINIHPTKTEIKFEDERAIYQIIHAAVREAIGKANIGPTLDFETQGVVDIPVLTNGTDVKQPEIPINPNFNPFETGNKNQSGGGSGGSGTYKHEKSSIPSNWQDLYAAARSEDEFYQSKLNLDATTEETTETLAGGLEYFQVKGKYIITNVKSGMLIVNQRRAHERILYEEILRSNQNAENLSQKTLYPEKINLSSADYELIKELMEDMEKAGFEFSDLTNDTIVVQGVPAFINDQPIVQVIETFLENFKQTEFSNFDSLAGKMAASMAAASALPYGRKLHTEEMRDIVDKLFSCNEPNYTPRGKKTLKIISMPEMEQLLEN